MIVPTKAALSPVYVLDAVHLTPHQALVAIFGFVHRPAVIFPVELGVALVMAMIAVAAIEHAALDVARLGTVTIVN